MIRRLEIAQSTLHRPRLLFLDEPTVGLDPLAREAVWEHIRKLRSELGTTLFLTTHYMDEADGLCNRIAIMHRGRLAIVAARPSSRPRWAGRTRRSTTCSSTTPATRWNREGPSVRLQEIEGPPSAAVEPAAGLAALRWAAALVRKTLVIAELEIRKLRHDYTEVITRGIQPVLWLLLFGQVFSRARAIPTGGVPYLDFMAPGILAQSVLFVAIFYGISIIWERDLD